MHTNWDNTNWEEKEKEKGKWMNIAVLYFSVNEI